MIAFQVFKFLMHLFFQNFGHQHQKKKPSPKWDSQKALSEILLSLNPSNLALILKSQQTYLGFVELHRQDAMMKVDPLPHKVPPCSCSPLFNSSPPPQTLKLYRQGQRKVWSLYLMGLNVDRDQKKKKKQPEFLHRVNNSQGGEKVYWSPNLFQPRVLCCPLESYHPVNHPRHPRWYSRIYLGYKQTWVLIFPLLFSLGQVAELILTLKFNGVISFTHRIWENVKVLWKLPSFLLLPCQNALYQR